MGKLPVVDSQRFKQVSHDYSHNARIINVGMIEWTYRKKVTDIMLDS